MGDATFGPLWGSGADGRDVVIRGPQSMTPRNRYGQAFDCPKCQRPHRVRADRLRAAYDRAVAEGRKRLTLPNDLRGLSG